MDSLGDRIKKYEATFNYTAVKRMPLIIRVDGKSFHTLLRNSKKPFDTNFIKCMMQAAFHTSNEMQGFKIAYIASDEATFCLTDYDNINTQGWFDYKLSKIVSISAALMSVNFNSFYKTNAVFDSRAFSVPIDDVVNTFLWRAKDWQRNSIQMYARSFFSQKELHNKNIETIHEMLYKIGKNWTNDLTDQEKNGTFIILNKEISVSCVQTDILPNYIDIHNSLKQYFP